MSHIGHLAARRTEGRGVLCLDVFRYRSSQVLLRMRQRGRDAAEPDGLEADF